MRWVKFAGILPFLFTLLACNGAGAWDDIKDILFGDVRDSYYARFTFDDEMNPAADVSGNGFHGTMSGAVWVNDGSRGGVLELDGTDDYVAVPAITPNAPELTVCSWVKIDALVSNFSSIYCVSVFNPRGIHYHVLKSGRLQVGIGSAAPQNYESTYNVNPGDIGRWIHVALVYDRSEMRATHYINGEPDVTGMYTVADDLNLGEAWIGGWVGGSAPSNTRWFDGRIDDLRLYSRALTDDEIRRVYAATR